MTGRAPISIAEAFSVLVLPWSSSEPWFEPDHWSAFCTDRTGMRFGPSRTVPNPEPHLPCNAFKAQSHALTSRSSRFAMVTLTFGILKTFFDLSCPEVRIPHTLLSDNAYLFNQAQGSFNAYYELVGDWVFAYKGNKCALNPDGSLKDAKDIVFYNDPDDAVPISAPSSSAQPPTDAFSVLLQTGRKPVPLTAAASVHYLVQPSN
ncbi:hypothetical protein F4604DRAFT_1672784 [Suillus subluteus]|nr:hypothetical protein F4604DRAFT_1672784 [Suillus subluteus]